MSHAESHVHLKGETWGEAWGIGGRSIGKIITGRPLQNRKEDRSISIQTETPCLMEGDQPCVQRSRPLTILPARSRTSVASDPATTRAYRWRRRIRSGSNTQTSSKRKRVSIFGQMEELLERIRLMGTCTRVHSRTGNPKRVQTKERDIN